MQAYRTDAGKLGETWVVLEPLGSLSSDAVAQDRWASPPPRPVLD